MTPGECISEFRFSGALWEHGGDSRQPHALLTGGYHAGGYTNMGVIRTERILPMVFDLLESFDPAYLNEVGHITGPANGARPVIQVIERIFHLIGPPLELQFSCPKKEVEGSSKRLVPDEQFRKIVSGTKVLLVDDVLTTGSSLGLIEKAVEERGGIVLPHVVVLVNQSGSELWHERQVISLFSREIKRYPADDCPLCRMGSEAIRPREGSNWKRLTAQY